MALRNKATVTVSSVAILLCAANPDRKRVFIKQSSANPVRIGGVGILATTGYRLGQNESLTIESSGGGAQCPTEDIYGIREGGVDGTVHVLEEDDLSA